MLVEFGDDLTVVESMTAGNQVVTPSGAVTWAIYGPTGTAAIATGTATQVTGNKYRFTVTAGSPVFARNQVYYGEFLFTYSSNPYNKPFHFTVV